MADIDVKAYIEELRRGLPYVPPVPVQKIKALHRKRKLGDIVYLIRSTMNVGVGLTLHWTSGPPPKGHESAPAWIKLPEPMPYYGTRAFKELTLDVFILKSFAAESTYDQLAILVAHELSHVVLESIEHPLRSQEKAVDLTAMLLGFSYLYRTAAHSVRGQLGYLSKEEVDTACKFLVPHRMRARHAALNYLQQSAGALILLAICAGVWAYAEAPNIWNALQIAVDRMTITEVRAVSRVQTATPAPLPQQKEVEVLGDRVRCDVRFGDLHLPASEYRTFFDRCMTGVRPDGTRPVPPGMLPEWAAALAPLGYR